MCEQTSVIYFGGQNLLNFVSPTVSNLAGELVCLVTTQEQQFDVH